MTFWTSHVTCLKNTHELFYKSLCNSLEKISQIYAMFGSSEVEESRGEENGYPTLYLDVFKIK